jgi:hypothetical protein
VSYVDAALGRAIADEARGVTEIAYTVPGKPASWARKRVATRTRGGKSLRKPRFFTDDKQAAASARHAAAFVEALGYRAGRVPPDVSWPTAGAFSVEVRGYYASAVVADADRLASLALDALQGVAYATDRQVRRVVAEVHADGSAERVEVRIVRLAADPVQPKVRAAKPRARRKVGA